MKTVLITGANRGIGLSFVKKYLDAGWRVIATARKPAKATETGSLQIERLDVGDLDSIASLKKSLGNTPIHLLINNAGMYLRDTFSTLNVSSLVDQFKINSVGPLMVTQALFPNLLIQGELTKVVNITSRMGSIEDSSTDSYGYRASKTALNMFTKLISNEMKHQRNEVCVIALHPGYVITDMTSKKGDISPDDAVEKMAKVIEKVKMSDSGSFLHRDGHTIPW